MLISGMTLSQLDTGLIIQLDKGEENDSLKFIQQVGRSLRSNNPEIYILYVKGTMDEEYLNNALKVIGKEYLVE
jgi:ERCC4-related helicase